MAAAEGLAFLQRLTGCAETRIASVDVSIFMHSSHSLDLAEDERVYLSVRDLRRRDADQLIKLGKGCHIQGLDLDATLFLRAWACRAENPFDADPQDMRICGEIRVPVHRLVTHWNSMLYHTWLTLDSPGLHDSVASIGLMTAADDGAELDQRLVNGPRQLFQPKVLVSICRMDDVAASGKLVMAKDAPDDVRASQWGPLLLSQQHHAIMSSALHLHRSQSGSKTAGQQNEKQEQQIRALRQQLETQSADMAQFKGQVQDGGTSPSVREFRVDVGKGDPMESLEAELAAQAQELKMLREAVVRRAQAKAASGAFSEVEEMRDSNARREHQIHAMRGESNKVREEASKKVEAASDRIEAIRVEKQEALQECDKLQADTRKVAAQRDELARERNRLSEQKEALLKIVEDLHQACNIAGLPQENRPSITMNFGIS